VGPYHQPILLVPHVSATALTTNIFALFFGLSVIPPRAIGTMQLSARKVRLLCQNACGGVDTRDTVEQTAKILRGAKHRAVPAKDLSNLALRHELLLSNVN